MQPETGQPAVASGEQMATDHGEFGERLVNVRAIVMSWDDKYSGWQPLDGGGLTNVSLYQRLRSSADVGVGADSEPGPSHAPLIHTPSAPSYEYNITGERVEDKKMTLQCRVTKDINYRQVMPTFHHWQIGERKYGLKFMTSYEGSKFHNRLQKAVQHLHQQSKSSSGESNGEGDDLEDDVFIPVELPLSRAESWESGVTSRSMPGQSIATIHFPPTAPSVSVKKKKSAVSTTGVPLDFGARPPPGRTPTWPKTPAAAEAHHKISAASTGPYVLFQKESSSATVYMRAPQTLHRPASTGGLHAAPSTSFSHLTTHQVTRGVSLARSTGLEKRESSSSLKIPLVHHFPSPSFPSSRREVGGRHATRASTGRASPAPMEMLRRERCFYCKAVYLERDNRRGACPSAPDACSKWIRRGTCLWCAECLLFRCCQGWTDGDADVCSCSPDVPKRTVRWALLSCLALLMPCLCLYPPLFMCNKECRRRAWIGGRHRPSGSTQSSGSGGGRSSSAARMSTPEGSSGHYK